MGVWGPSMSIGEDGKWKKNTPGVSAKNPTPKLNAKKIAKLMVMMKGKKSRTL